MEQRPGTPTPYTGSEIGRERDAMMSLRGAARSTWPGPYASDIGFRCVYPVPGGVPPKPKPEKKATPP